ncbi:hemerythrin domain-containing protein [Actinomadura sp. 1N219]|uniref:hemerythrin domain-containing protein n=1 Tax=Actinomadura sp. 1N219 TaxID=3375152 RepID=UPI00379DF7F8
MEAFAIQPREMTCHTILRAAHDAFLRDADRLAAAVAAGKGRAAHVRAGWENFKDLFRAHHDLEDRVLWPRVERAVGGRRVELAVLAEVRAEHARLEPLIGRVDAAMEDGGDLRPAVAELRAALETYLRHEETGALPLAESVLADEEWRALADEARRRCEARTPMFVPWVVDGIAPIERSRFLTALPAPVRDLNRVMWEPHYRKRRLWSV